MNKKYNKILTYVLLVLLMLVASYAFVPEVLGGKIVDQSDISGFMGMSHEMHEHNKAHPDDITQWSNSMFGGMPTTVISAPREGDWTQKIYDLLLTGKRPATYLFISMLGAFLLMLSLGIDAILAAGGAVAVTFCSYNLQIIQVGHNTKMQAIAFLPWVLAALIFTYRSAVGSKDKIWRRPLLGSILFAFALSFQVKANHQQITYYLAIMVLLYALTVFIWIVADKERRALIGRFFAASALLLVLGLAGIATNSNKLIPVYRYTPYSMRGGSELAAQNSAGDGQDGLALGYATAWSYGWEELPNLLIPNYNGGSSAGAVNISKSATYDLLKRAGQPNAENICKSLPLYWGPQPFTAGPMYMGAVTIFLFVLGLFFYRGKEKWWLLVCTLLAILLSLGNHLMWFTRLWYDHVPFYNKFRTVSMALVVLQFTLPILGFLTLDGVVRQGVTLKEFLRKGGAALAITGGFCLLCALVPSIAGNFTGRVDASQQQLLVDALKIDRRHLLVVDALRSLVLIVSAFALLCWGLMGKEAASRTRTAAALVCALVLLDVFTVGKRYLGPDDFTTPKAFKGQFAQREVDKYILEDPDPSYRVLDLSISTFNDAHTSYWHKCVGGYSPAKLQRYQELIMHYLKGEIEGLYEDIQGATTVGELAECMQKTKVLDMLNTRYVILDADVVPIENPYSYGNAWFVDEVKQADTPSDELRMLGEQDLLATAILAPADAAAAQGAFQPAGSADSIVMTHYAANELRYHYRADSPRLCVFSEVYYPDGWHAWIADDASTCPDVDASAAVKLRAAAHAQDVPVFRADWILRAAVLPAGEHDLIMRFDPDSNRLGTAISRASSISIILLLLLCGGAMAAPALRKRS